MILVGLPGSYFPNVPVQWKIGPDKIVHALMFSGLPFSILWGYRDRFIKGDLNFRIKSCVIVLMVAITYGAVTELLQSYVFVGRYGSVFDFLADVIGCIIGVFVFVLIYIKKIKKKVYDLIIISIFARRKNIRK